MIPDAELRAMVRAAIAQRSGAMGTRREPLEWCRVHPSHGRVQLEPQGDGGGACLIEPTVGCTHCGYCQSFGH